MTLSSASSLENLVQENLADDRKFTELHLAAIAGDETKLEDILEKDPSLLNVFDRLGMSALHYSAIYENFNCLKALVDKGAELFTLSDVGKLPIDYLFFDKHSEMIQFLEENGSFKGATWIHWFAYYGFTESITNALVDEPNLLNMLDYKGNSPLMYAVMNMQKEAFRTLIEHGADPFLLNHSQVDLVDEAKFRLGLETDHNKILEWESFIDEIKSVCGLSRHDLEKLRISFSQTLSEQALVASMNNKKLLIIMGEVHFIYINIQVEKVFLDVAKNNNITTFLVEEHPEVLINHPSDLYAADRLQMTVIGIDSARKLDSMHVDMAERNLAMTQAIFESNQPAIIRTGAIHLKGLLEMPDFELSDEFYERYHVVPFDLTSLIKSPEHNYDIGVATRFLNDTSFTDVDLIVNYWNAFDGNPRPSKMPRRYDSSTPGLFFNVTNWCRTWFSDLPGYTEACTSRNEETLVVSNAVSKRRDRV